MIRIAKFFALTLVFAGTSAAAQTAPPTSPPLAEPDIGDSYGGSLDTRLQAEFSRPAGGRSRATVFSDADLQLFYNRGNLSLNAELKLERTRRANLNSYYPDRNAAFRSEAVTLRQLYATYRVTDTLEFSAGKIHPKFGSAYSDMPGLFYNFATDYEQDERIGAGFAWRLGDLGPLHALVLSGETFYLDTSVLSATLPRGPAIGDPTADRAWRYTRGQFGPANTGRLDSATIALRGGHKGQGLTWQASLTREATADPAGATEFGQSFSASYDPTGDGIPLTPRPTLTPFAEYAHFTNYAGINGLERHYALAGAALGFRGWELAASLGIRQSRGIAGGTDQQQNLSLTYEIIKDFKLGAGINHVRINGRQSWTLAPAASYHMAF